MKRFFFVYLSVFLFCPAIIFAQDAGHMDNKKKWENMNPKQRYEMQKRYREWKSLPSEKQEKLKRSFKSYNELTPADKKRLKERFKVYKTLGNGDKKILQRRLNHIKNMPPEKKRETIQKHRGLHQMSDKEREQYLKGSSFWKGLNENEKKVFKKFYFPSKSNRRP
jgi:hypothetical protein